MNQTDSMKFHATMLQGLFSQFLGIEYSRALDRLEADKPDDFETAPQDDEDPRGFVPPSVTMSLEIQRAFHLAQEAANIYCCSTGFAEEIPLDDRRPGGPALRATVPPQFRFDVEPPAPATGKSLGKRKTSRVEGVAVIERFVDIAMSNLHHDADLDSKEAKYEMICLRVSFSKQLRSIGVDVPILKMPPEQTGRKPFDFDDPINGGGEFGTS